MNRRIINKIILVTTFIILVNLKCHKAKNPILFEESPTLKIEFPLEYPYNLVGKDVVITITGKAYDTDLVEILYKGEMLGYNVRKEDKYIWRFTIDVYKRDWGEVGEKILIVRAWRQGEYKDYQLKIINNDADLQQKAIEYIRFPFWKNYEHTNYDKYDGAPWRMVNKRIYIYNKELKSQQELIYIVIEHFRKWTGFTFEYVNEAKDNSITLRGYDNCAAGTMGAYKIDDKIPLVRSCYILVEKSTEVCQTSPIPTYSKIDRYLKIIAHEIAHCIGFGHSGEGYAPYEKDISITSLDCCALILNPYQQRAAKIVYSNPPGTKFN